MDFSRRHGLSFVLAITGGVIASCSSAAPKTYRPTLTDVTLHDGDKALAIAEDGRLYASSDFASWVASSAISTSPLRAITSDGSAFLVAGDGASYFFSRDDFTWSTWSDPQAGVSTFWGVASCAGRYYVVGDHGIALTSTDNKTWAPILNLTATDSLVGVACDANHVVIVTESDAAYVAAVGGSFTRVAGTGSACAVRFGAGVFLEVRYDGTVETSADGTTWTVTATAQWSANDCNLAFGSGTFVFIDDAGDILTSGDGKTWTRLDYGASTPLSGVAVSDSGKMLAVGAKGTAVGATCSAGQCTQPKKHDVLTDAPAGSGGGGGGGSCDGGLRASMNFCAGSASGSSCDCTGDPTDACIPGSFFTQNNVPVPAACTPPNAGFDCMDANTRLITKPCCPGYTCVVGTSCGGSGRGSDCVKR